MGGGRGANVGANFCWNQRQRCRCGMRFSGDAVCIVNVSPTSNHDGVRVDVAEGMARSRTNDAAGSPEYSRPGEPMIPPFPVDSKGGAIKSRKVRGGVHDPAGRGMLAAFRATSRPATVPRHGASPSADSCAGEWGVRPAEGRVARSRQPGQERVLVFNLIRISYMYFFLC